METFHETQHARKPLFIALPIVLWLAFMVYAVIELNMYFNHGKPLGKEGEELPLGIFIGIMLLINLTFAFLLFMVLKINIKISISSSGLYFEMPPFKKGVLFRQDEVEAAWVRKYYPVKEYGGWGYRGFKRIKAYNISGRHGIQLILKDKRRLLIGVKNHEAAEKALQMAGFKSNSPK